MNEPQNIDFFDLVQCRKNMQQNTSEYEQIDKQIKDAEWLFMRTIFYLVDCLDKNFSIFKKDEKFDLHFLVDVLRPIFANPSSDNFKKINRILNQKNMKDMLNEFFYFRFEVMNISINISILDYLHFNLSFYIDNEKVNDFNKLVQEMFTSRNPETYIKNLKKNEKYIPMLEEFKKKYLEFWNTEIEKIPYINDCFPQTSQGSYYLSSKGKNIKEMSRDIDFEKFSIIYVQTKDNFTAHGTLSIEEEISKREILEKKYTEDNIEQTFSLFEFISSEHEYFEDFYYATNYLESRFITCHFDRIFFESNEQPNELTKNFYMKIWLENSIILQNLMRFHLNSNSPIYNKAREKFRSDEFKRYVLENPEKINDLLFAFIFMPNEFADCNDYEQLISNIKISKYYSAIMRIDKFMFTNYLDYKPYVYFENFGNATRKHCYSLVKFFSKINPTKENEIDKLLLSNKLLIEIAISQDDNSKFDYIANLNSSNFNYHTKNYDKKEIAKGICSLVVSSNNHNFSQEQEDFLKNSLDELDLEKLNFIASVFQQYPEELDNIVDSISNAFANNQETFDAYDSMKKCEYKILKKREETKRSKIFLVISPIAFIIAAISLALLISLFFPPFVLLGLEILSSIAAGLILTIGAGIAFGWLFINEYLQSRKNLHNLSKKKISTEKNKSDKTKQTNEIYKGNGKPNQYKYSERTEKYSDIKKK